MMIFRYTFISKIFTYLKYFYLFISSFTKNDSTSEIKDIAAKIEKQTKGKGDKKFLEQVYQKSKLYQGIRSH